MIASDRLLRLVGLSGLSKRGAVRGACRPFFIGYWLCVMDYGLCVMRYPLRARTPTTITYHFLFAAWRWAVGVGGIFDELWHCVEVGATQVRSTRRSVCPTAT